MIFDVIKIFVLVLSHTFCAVVFYLAGRGKTSDLRKVSDSDRQKEGWESILNYNHRRGGDTE